mmetsp:Transcript_1236/g.4434  ORF Transcript_1236/g.4434 Transcript_1236/m.4434 type:complete len:489 (-) Transcript_1236:121-1587(-)
MASEALAWVHLVILVGTVFIGGVVVSNNASRAVSTHASAVLSELKSASVALGGPGMRSVALGYNANLDLVCDSSAVLRALGSPPPPDVRAATTKISSREEFFSNFAFYYNQGSAAERYVDDLELFNSIVDALVDEETSAPRGGCAFHTGGNAALMANRFAALGVATTLGGPVGSALAQLLDPKVTVTNPGQESADEVHLIMEHQRGDQWKAAGKTLVSPRANRFIVSHDVQNSRMDAIESLDAHLSKGGVSAAEVLVVAGAHLLEGISETERESRLSVLRGSLEKTKGRGTAVHFELAGVGDERVLYEIASAILPVSASIGLNEQELGSLYIATGGSSYSIDDFTVPTIHCATHAIEHVLGLPMAAGVSRLHLHYLTFHLIAQRTGDDVRAPWSRAAAEQAVAAGALATTAIACGDENGNVNPADVRVQPYGISSATDVAADSLFMRFSSPVSGLEFRVAPVLVCKAPARTVGLGDSISSTGLAYHIV